MKTKMLLSLTTASIISIYIYMQLLHMRARLLYICEC